MNEATDAAFFDDIRAALSLLEANNTADAVDKLRAVLRRHPARAEPFYVLGLAAAQLGDVGRATTLIEHAHQLDPECKEYADVLSVVYTRIGKLTEGMYFAKLATALEPHAELENLVPPSVGSYSQALGSVEPPHHFVNALIAFNQRRFQHAADLCGMALRIDSRRDDCHALLGRCLFETGEYERAAAAYHSAIHLKPGAAAHYVGLGRCLYHLGRFWEAEACHAKAVAVDPESVEAAAGALRGLRFAPAGAWRGRGQVEDELERRLSAHPAVAQPDLLQSVPPPPSGRIRIGYVGNRFHDGPDAAFFVPLIANHDRSRFEVYCYQQSVTQHDIVLDLQLRVDGWREIYDLDPEVVASIIQSDGIDALVDLGGLTEGNPLPALAIKPAPLRIGWLNHLDGTGTATVNLILSDPATEEIDRAGLRPGQECLTISSGLFALEPYFLLPAVGDSPAQEGGRATFGGRADLARVTPEVARTWAEILNAAPDTRLLLGGVRGPAPAVRERLAELFAHFGVAGRVSFHESEAEGLIEPEFYGEIDVLLDTFPVAGTEETCQALWMGVPVVALKGDRRCARYGASILRSAGRAEWIAADAAAYVKVAAALAADAGALAATRAGLRPSLEASDLFNPTLLARAVEAGIDLVLKTKAAAEPPARPAAAPAATAMPAAAGKARKARGKAKPAPKPRAKVRPQAAKAKAKPSRRK
jgi:predicted O-linked N-acetylglucosamine transferase (SPINDLY family)